MIFACAWVLLVVLYGKPYNIYNLLYILYSFVYRCVEGVDWVERELIGEIDGGEP